MVTDRVRLPVTHRTRPASLALLAAVVALAVLGAPSQATARPLYTGMSGVYDYVPRAYEQVRASGASFVRIGVPWEAIAPKRRPGEWQPTDPADPAYDWDGHIDGAVVNAVAAGLTPLLMINSVPEWAEACIAPNDYPEASCKPEPGPLADFATALARRFSGGFGGLPRVRYWQGLNEPNLSLYFLPQFEDGRAVSADLYRPAANAFYAAVKAVDPSNLVLAAGLGPIAVPKYTIGPLRFTRELLCMRGSQHPRPAPGDCGGGVSFDIFDIHPYTTGSPNREARPNDVQISNLGELRRLLEAAERAGRIHSSLGHVQLWVNEFSWDSKPPDPRGLAMGTECRWTAEAMYKAWRAGVDHFFWYGLRDEPLGGGSAIRVSAQSGLYFRGNGLAGDRPKRVFYVFRFPFVAFPGKRGLTVWGRTPSGGAGKVSIQVRRGGWRTVKTLRASANGIFSARLPTTYGRDRNGAVRARFEGVAAVPFPMGPSPEFLQPPFGSVRPAL
jgi:hypothetical protein